MGKLPCKYIFILWYNRHREQYICLTANEIEDLLLCVIYDALACICLYLVFILLGKIKEITVSDDLSCTQLSVA